MFFSPVIFRFPSSSTWLQSHLWLLFFFAEPKSASSGSFKAWIPCCFEPSNLWTNLWDHPMDHPRHPRHPRHPPVVAWSSPQRSFSRYPREILKSRVTSHHKSRRWMAECLAGQAGKAGLPTTFKPPSGTGLDASCLAKEARHIQTHPDTVGNRQLKGWKSDHLKVTQLFEKSLSCED